jgi:Plasmid pRiA4b ORF-3-like protein
MPGPDPVVYQLRVVLRGVSPLVWRRLLVRSDTTVAELHEVLQVAFGWDGEHLHRFVIHGAEYGIEYDRGVDFRDDARRVPLARFGFRAGERFVYEYDFSAAWHHDIRVEAIVAVEAGRGAYPRCTGGRRAGPSEGCDGPWAFMDACQRRLSALVRTAQIISVLLDDPDGRLADYPDELAELAELHPLISKPECLDRRALNRRLAELAPSPRRSP